MQRLFGLGDAGTACTTRWKPAMICAALTLLTACGGPADAPSQSPQPAATRTAADEVIARIGARVITTSQVDTRAQLPLHDLEMQKYRLRRRLLEAELLRDLDATHGEVQTAEILLTPPAPPRVTIEVDRSRARPAAEKPVTVLAFCNFESPHCGRLQMTLEQVLPLFGSVVRYVERDLPLEFHRHAGKAAEAARCALEQGNYWRFHDSLYATGELPDRAVLDRTARAANLEMDRFSECLDSGRHAAEVAADVAAAKSLGLSVVPAVFVNGLYASPDVQPADLVWLIERELASLGMVSPRLAPADVVSTAPLRLRSLLASPYPGQGLALLSPSITPERVRAYREGDAIATDTVLRSISKGGIEIMRNGHAERLGFEDGSPSPGPVAGPTADGAVESPHRAVPVTLDRNQVLVLMSDRIALAEALQPVTMTTDGQRRLKVKSVASGSLYELLGLEPGDVILSVNEQPITEASNPLWDALEKEGEVRVRVMRRGGLAKHFTYRFDD